MAESDQIAYRHKTILTESVEHFNRKTNLLEEGDLKYEDENYGRFGVTGDVRYEDDLAILLKYLYP